MTEGDSATLELDLKQNHFELLGLPQRFRIDPGALSQAYRRMQSALHPDRFARAGDQARRLAVQGAAQVNEAYAVLRDDGRRARYLLELHGVAVDEERDTAQDPEFLMEQMELREALEAAEQEPRPLEAVERVRADIDARHKALLQAFEGAFEAGDLAAAKAEVLKIRFFERLRQEATALAERLEDRDLP
ncbi:Fe-S protein assembly co-chaperone HscB [Ectothiorhodospira mobilis]|uniref:Fe-S protein assembly co-chaperone HscB n=1 Tax=Ectothiorhodospira mobilis TaxID=195064 RepID=UPI001EE93E1C|nr:Fe-S protein assembly co-chaperone HscB [Ectothiorhodospira mobilis]MCG5535684.1 Fe-S protein assembly co-chaperone HscB [Ectothiorhodospira mobilis]